jgi:hypothetical protein
MAYSSQEIEDIFNKVCERIQNGEAVRTILLESDMPSSRTFFKWLDELDENDAKVKQYARATTKRADAIFDEILDIADENNADVYIDDGVAKIDGNTVQRSRLRVDARKWVASKLNPKKYGDKLDVGIKGGMVVKYQNVSKKFDENGKAKDEE